MTEFSESAASIAMLEQATLLKAGGLAVSGGWELAEGGLAHVVITSAYNEVSPQAAAARVDQALRDQETGAFPEGVEVTGAQHSKIHIRYDGTVADFLGVGDKLLRAYDLLPMEA